MIILMKTTASGTKKLSHIGAAATQGLLPLGTNREEIEKQMIGGPTTSPIEKDVQTKETSGGKKTQRNRKSTRIQTKAKIVEADGRLRVATMTTTLTTRR